MFEPEEAYMEEFDEIEDEFIDEVEEPSSSLSLATEAESESDSTTPDDEPPRPKGRPSLRVVK